MAPEALDALTPEERRQVYGMLRFKVEVYADGCMVARGILSEDVCDLHVNGHANGDERFCENDLVSPSKTCGSARIRSRQCARRGSGHRPWPRRRQRHARRSCARALRP